ncbi:MAG: hypothetical protein JWO32_2628, partial [Bacteroidetes bacterium]|nr:hypothetical protein [Bacteroidota bacterium]
MKKNTHFLFVLSFLLFSTLCFAQPANNNCAGAQAITIGAVPPCGVGVQTSANTSIFGTLNGATPGNPYIYQTGCTGSSSIQTSPANDVWYSFVATGYHANITVNSAFSQPNISLYSGSCASLGGGVGGCAVGTGGSANLQVDQLTPGSTYYIQVSGGTGQTGNFNLIINNSVDCAGCLQGTSMSVNPLPVNGAYPANTTVTFCFHINQYNHVNTNWLHGVQLTLGSGWNAASIVPNNPVSPSAGGSWQWVNGSYTANGQTWTQGWYWETAMPTLNPANNFGDPATNATAAQWNFCVDVTTKPACTPGSNLSVDFNTSGDGESGSWINAACSGDPPTSFNAIGACCPPNMTALPADCFGTLTGDATATPVGAQGPYTYNWSGPAGYTSSSTGVAGANTINNIAAGVYTVQIIDKNLCAITNTVSVTQPPILTSNLTPVNANCTTPGSISSVVGGGTPGYTYSWSGPGAYSSAAANATGLTLAGTYTLTVTDSKGCPIIKTAAITQPATVTAGFTGAFADCLLGNSYTFNNTGSVGGGITYAYTFNPSVGAPPTGNTANYGPVSFTAPGTYTVKETVTQGVCTATAANVVVINPDPSATLTFTNATCGLSNGVIVINNTSSAGQTISTFASSVGSVSGQTVTGLGASTPLITLTNNFGCTFTVSTPITNTPPITALATTFVNPTCGNNNGSITLGAVTGGSPTFSYSINGGAFTTAPTLTNLAPGAYNIVVKDVSGCTFPKTVTLVNQPGPTAITFTTAATTCVGNVGQVGITGITGGTPAFTFSLNGVSSPSVNTGLSAGAYILTVKDNNGCTFSTTATVNSINGPSSATVAFTNATCGASNGSATLTGVTGGTSPYQYSFNGGAFSATTIQAGLNAGPKSVVVKDANSCTLTVNFTIGNTGAPTAAVSSFSNVSCFGGSNGSFTVTPSGGTPGFNYTLTPGNITNGFGTFTGLTAQAYTVVAQDAAGCVTSLTTS